MPTSSTLPGLVTDQQELDALCIALERQDEVAMDTEFVRTNTYAPRLGLLQLVVNGTPTCVDPLAGMNLDRLWELLFDNGRLNILHSAKQDMEVIWFVKGALIGQLLDTQVCAGLLGYPAQIGYAGLASELLDVSISKDQTRTDWSRRPLTDAQLKYAAEDVQHLPEMREIMQARLEAEGRFAWAVEDSNALLDIDLYRPHPEAAWQRIKSVPYLPIDQQARACALADWRERRAIQADKPRQWVLADKALLQIAQQNPANQNALDRLEEVPAAVARKQGRKLLAVLDNANHAFANGELDLQQRVSERDQDKTVLKKLTAMVRTKADELDIAAEVLASKRDIQALLRGEESARVMTGWRRETIGTELAAELG